MEGVAQHACWFEVAPTAMAFFDVEGEDTVKKVPDAPP